MIYNVCVLLKKGTGVCGLQTRGTRVHTRDPMKQEATLELVYRINVRVHSAMLAFLKPHFLMA